MVSGFLLGLAMENGVLEITHSSPYPQDHKSSHNNNESEENDASGLEGHEFQLEMMRMLREVNVDNNCVGWYQSMYLGIFSTSALLENQLSYQTDLSPNSVVILYDPMQTAHGTLVLKCYRLSDECIRLKTSGDNAFIHPKNIFEEIPVKLTNPGLARLFLADVADGVHASSSLTAKKADTTLDRLDLSTNPYLEKHLEFLCGWVDDLSAEQQKFQFYTRQLARSGGKDNRSNRHKQAAPTAQEMADGWASSDAPRRMESLLITNQIRSYCDQMDQFTTGGLSKLFLAGGLHKESK
jgi:translation initiation factor 3 subunit H